MFEFMKNPMICSYLKLLILRNYKFSAEKSLSVESYNVTNLFKTLLKFIYSCYVYIDLTGKLSITCCLL